MARRAWTPSEDLKLSADYRREGGPAASRALGRSLSSVYQRARKLGLAHQSRADTASPDFAATLRSLHAEGLSDPEIAARLGCERHTVSRQRRAIGLPSNALGPRRRRLVAERTREQCRAAGVASLAEVRALSFRRFARESGWPADLSPREVRIVEVLMDRGPMTRPQIAQAVGMPWNGSRRSLKGNGPGGSYLATLARRGLVVRLGRVVRGEGRGKFLNLYSLSMTAERSVQHG